MRVPYLDYRVTDAAERAAYLAAMDAVLRDGEIILGSALGEFERELAAYCGARHAVGVGSGTDAIHLALSALGIGAGDEVITTCFSYIGTANAIALAGARPVFVDIGDDLNLDPAAVVAAIGPRVKAILPVHLGGQLCDMTALAGIAARHGIALVEDAAQAIGAADPAGRKAGSFGAIGCLSLNPMKILKGFGEGGAVLTNDDALAERVTALRDNRFAEIAGRVVPGHNGRLDTVQAAALRLRLARLDAAIERRRSIAARYRAAFAGLMEAPRELSGYRDVFYSYTLQTDRRDDLQAHLTAAGIGTRIQYAALMPHQPAYRAVWGRQRFPRAEAATARVLSLPCYESLTDRQVDATIEAVCGFFGRRAA